jgi:hypothetical protein
MSEVKHVRNLFTWGAISRYNPRSEENAVSCTMTDGDKIYKHLHRWRDLNPWSPTFARSSGHERNCKLWQLLQSRPAQPFVLCGQLRQNLVCMRATYLTSGIYKYIYIFICNYIYTFTWKFFCTLYTTKIYWQWPRLGCLYFWHIFTKWIS